MKRFALFTSTFVILGLGAFSIRPLAQSQAAGSAATAQHEEHHPLQAPTPAQEQQMMDMHQKMMAAMHSQDAALQALVAKMDAAKGQARIDTMADLLKAVVQQRTSMRDDMMKMQGMMMDHMMQHMASGMTPEAKAAVEACPMMKMMKAMGGGGQ